MKRFAVVLVAMLLPAQMSQAQDVGTIAGTVAARETGAPLSGAGVSVLGTRLDATTGADGRYTIGGVPPGTYRVRARVIGYGIVEDTGVVVVAGQTTTVDFQLQAQAVQLEAVVAIGYATVQKRDVTGSVASTNGEDVLLKAAPTSAVSNALQGKIPGVQVVVNSGIPGAGASVRIRGSASISANSEPLYVIDGIPALQGTSSQDPTYNPLNEINPNDIESIQILKDASATSVYGARGATGVILISTKRGERDQDRLTFESSVGTQTVAKRISVLSGPQYMTLVNEAYTNAGRAPLRYSAGDIANAGTYDYPAMLLQTGLQRSNALTLSGGDAKTRYLISGNYLNQEGIIIKSGFERYGLRFNLDREVSNRFRTGTSLSLARVQQAIDWTENGGVGAGARGILAAMNFDPSLAPKDGSGTWNLRAILGEQLENPLANISELTDHRNEWRLVGNFFAEADIGHALRLKTTFGTNVHFWRNPYFAPRTIAPGYSVNGSATLGTGYERDLISENTAHYRRTFAASTLDILAGVSAQTGWSEWSSSHGENFTTDLITFNDLGAAAGRLEVGSGASDWVLLSAFGRANYSLRDRYLFSVTARRDGSSRFGPNNKWAFFPSAAFAWRLSDEPFLRGQRLFDDLKLRLSYGLTGNQAVSQYQALARLDRTFVGGLNREVVTQVPASAMPNPDLKWETTRQVNAGLDASLLDNRVTVTLDVYGSVTKDLLLWTDVPRTSGYDTQLRNVGSLQNRGVELGISSVNLRGGRLTWRSTLSLAANRNKVLDLGDRQFLMPGASRYGWFLDGQESYIVQVGRPLGSIFGYKVLGIFQAGDPCPLKNPTPTLECVPGEYRVADINGDSAITPADRTILGSADPKFYGGLSNNLSYGPFSLDVFFSFSYGNKVANVSNVFSMLATGFLNERTEVLDRWTPTNPDATIPRANNLRPRRLYSSFVEDGSFLRLQTLTIGYQLPRGLIPQASNARLYVTGQNVFVLSHYTGFDPEVNSIGGDSRFRGVDAGAYPRARAVNVGLSVTF